MITLTPFEGEFCQEIKTIYSVNNINPKSAWNYMTTYAECPNCQKGNFFRVYNPREEDETEELLITIYDCKCPHCETEFEIVDEYEKED